MLTKFQYFLFTQIKCYQKKVVKLYHIEVRITTEQKYSDENFWLTT